MFAGRLLFCLAVLPLGPAQAADLERPGKLPAARYLTPDLLSGAEFKVAPEAESDGFGITYQVTSRFGTWPARNRMQVASRIREIAGLAQLEEVSKSEVFTDAVKNSVTAPVRLVQSVAEKPAETLKGIPSGVSRWMKKTSFQVKEGYHDAKEMTAKDDEVGEAEKKSDKSTSDQAKSAALGYLKISKAELNWYAKLGVDPYTDNQLLRDGVSSVAKVEGLTSFGMKFVSLPGIPGAGEMRRTMDMVWKTDPWELRLQNRKQLLAAGLTEETARAFEDNPWVSLSQQTLIVASLGQLAGVGGREHLVARELAIGNRADAQVLATAIALLVRMHRDVAPLAEILPGTLLPVAATRSGELAAVLLSDALFWTAEVADAAREFAQLYAGRPAKARQLWVVGEVSPAFRAGARPLGWEVRDRWQIADKADATPSPAGGR